MEIIHDTTLLFFLGICGWGLFSILRFPAASVLGSLTVIGFFRITEWYLIPPSPDYLLLLIQVMLGCYAGTKITRETVGELRTMIKPAFLIVFWALSMVFLLTFLLRITTTLDLYTSLLSSSIGGLPEMTIIALDSGADVIVIVIMQTFRMVMTILLFPFIAKKMTKEEDKVTGDGLSSSEGSSYLQSLRSLIRLKSFLDPLKQAWEKALNIARGGDQNTFSNAGDLLLTIAIGTVGGYLILSLGVPAGAMIGAMFAVAITSVAGVSVRPLPGGIFNYMLVGVGIMVSGSISPETLEVLKTGVLFFPVLLVTLITLVTSLGLALLIHKLVHWDYLTCFLAAAPGGFSVMTALAIKYNRDPFLVSLLHLCRLAAIKTVVPLIFMFLT